MMKNNQIFIVFVMKLFHMEHLFVVRITVTVHIEHVVRRTGQNTKTTNRYAHFSILPRPNKIKSKYKLIQWQLRIDICSLCYTYIVWNLQFHLKLYNVPLHVKTLFVFKNFGIHWTKPQVRGFAFVFSGFIFLVEEWTQQMGQ